MDDSSVVPASNFSQFITCSLFAQIQGNRALAHHLTQTNSVRLEVTVYSPEHLSFEMGGAGWLGSWL
jgi:hypothetical protein